MFSKFKHRLRQRRSRKSKIGAKLKLLRVQKTESSSVSDYAIMEHCWKSDWNKNRMHGSATRKVFTVVGYYAPIRKRGKFNWFYFYVAVVESESYGRDHTLTVSSEIKSWSSEDRLSNLLKPRLKPSVPLPRKVLQVTVASSRTRLFSITQFFCCFS